MTEYVTDENFTKIVEDMIANPSLPQFAPIREHELRIFPLICVRENAKGEPIKPTGPPVTCQKISAIYHALTDGHYVIVADNDFWTHANELQQKAALHHALMQINIEPTEKSIKLSRRKPDVMEFRATIAHFGAWNTNLIDFRDAFKQSAKQFAENHQATI